MGPSGPGRRQLLAPAELRNPAGDRSATEGRGFTGKFRRRGSKVVRLGHHASAMIVHRDVQVRR